MFKWINLKNKCMLIPHQHGFQSYIGFVFKFFFLAPKIKNKYIRGAGVLISTPA